MQTNGERYQYQEGEKENMVLFAMLIREAFAKLDEAKEFADKNDFGWFFSLWIDKDENGEYKVPTNYNTNIRISSTVEDEWMSSTQDC